MAINYHKLRSPALQVQDLLDTYGRVLRLPTDRAASGAVDLDDLEPLIRLGLVERSGRRGIYLIRDRPQPLIVDQLAVVPALVGDNPYYVSWWSALAFHRLTEQSPLTVFVATTAKRQTAKVQGVNYRFIRLAPRKFFGFRPVRITGSSVLIATRAKAVIDAIDHPEYSGGIGEVAKAVASPLVSAEELIAAARRHRVRVVAQRLGWFLEHVAGVDASDLLPMRNRGGSPLSVDPTRSPAGPIDQRWNLVVNVNAESLRASLLT